MILAQSSTKPSPKPASASARPSPSSAPGSATAPSSGPSSPDFSPGSTSSTSPLPGRRRKQNRRSQIAGTLIRPNNDRVPRVANISLSEEYLSRKTHPMETILNADGQIDIPKQIRDSDHLAPGDSFDLQRLAPGNYLLARRSPAVSELTIAVADDGLPVIRADGIITSNLVKEIESQTR
jgi:hypothetical protein